MAVQKDNIIKVIEIFYPNAKIYLFGSRARQDHNERSDIDIAIDAGEPIPLARRGQIMTMIDALNMIQQTDVVDFQRAPQALKDSILQEGIVWKN